MSILDEISEESIAKRPPCSVAEFLKTLNDTERAELEVALADKVTYSHRAITRVIQRRGFDMHDKRMALHRNGECRCYAG